MSASLEGEMTDWKKIAESIDPPIPAEAADKIIPLLQALEDSFRPLQRSIPAGADVWTGPEDTE
jgi:hypothetical protein